MEVAVNILGACALISGLLAGLFLAFTNHRYWGLWATCAAVVCAVFVFFCWYQDRLWKQDELETAQARGNKLAPDQRAWIEVAAAEFSGLAVGKIPEYTIQIKNTGKTPAVITRRATGLLIVGTARTRPGHAAAVARSVH